MTVLLMAVATVIVVVLPAAGFGKLGELLDGWEGWRGEE